jgi:hypothetical protein
MKANGFVQALHANGPARQSDLYAFLVGDWRMDVTAHSEKNESFSTRGEIHAGWVLEGRAIQDVWIIPRAPAADGKVRAFPVAGNWYGTTLRTYDPAIDAWRIFWIDPATNSFRQQIGRREDKGIVQLGKTESGALSRWSFVDVERDAFRWRAEVSGDDGATWRRVIDIVATRWTG